MEREIYRAPIFLEQLNIFPPHCFFQEVHFPKITEVEQERWAAKLPEIQRAFLVQNIEEEFLQARATVQRIATKMTNLKIKLSDLR